MKTILLKGEMRSEVGSRTAKELRKEGKVPCVMYADGKPGIHFAIYQADFKNLVYTHNVYKVKLDLDGNMHSAILQDMQFHPVSEAIIHADFMEVAEGKKVIMEIPINVVGNSPGVRAGGKLVKKINRLKVRGFLADMPDYIDVSIDTLEIGQSAKVKDVTADKIEILDSPANAILSVKTTRALMQAAAEEKASTGKKK
jgi:large subunit ribosomal protein L25